MSGNSGDRRSGVGDESPFSHTKHSCGALGQPHQDAVLRNWLHSAESSGISRKELSSQVLPRPGIVLSGKPTRSPKGQRLHLSACADTDAAHSVITKESIDSLVGLIVNSREFM